MSDRSCRSGAVYEATRTPDARTAAVAAEIVDLILGLTHRQGTATILVTHDRAHLVAVDQVVEVVDGHIVVACQKT